ncbi:MAG: GNAT family N-acetyltransferase [Gammaproteobacteria bacterium]|nr:GNAT family N-acetyltransferase [Gammaproteobacteria bacterium]
MITEFYAQKFPTLNVSQQLYLREQSLEDTENFYKYYTDPAVHKYILAAVPKTLSQAGDEIHYCRNLFYRRNGIYWTLARRDTNEMIGALGFHINNYHHRAEIHYDLAQPYWRQGIMFQALRTIVDFAMENMQLQRIEAQTLEGNVGSIGVLEKLGFIREAKLHNYRNFDGRFYDIELLAFTRPMWMRNRIALTKQPSSSI